MAHSAGLHEDEMATLAALLEKLDWGGIKDSRDVKAERNFERPPEEYKPTPEWLSETWKPSRAIVEQATRPDTRLSQAAWNALHGAVTMTCVELSVMYIRRNVGIEMLLIPRLPLDEHYPGQLLHGPGSVVYGHEPPEWTLARVWKNELGEVDITPPVHVGYRRAHGARGPEIAMHFVCLLHGEYEGRGSLFPIVDLPYERMIPHHRPLADRAQAWLSFYLRYNRKQRP